MRTEKTVKIELSTKSSGIKIFINGILHINIKDYSDYLGLYAYKIGKDNYCIDIYLKGTTIAVAYNDRDKWSEVLKLLNEVSGE